MKIRSSNNKEVFIGMDYNKKEVEDSVAKSLEKIIGVKKLHFQMDNLDIAAFANWKESEFNSKLQQIEKSIPGIKIVQASVLE